MTVSSTALGSNVRTYLQERAKAQQTITYQALAQHFQLRPPNTIRQITEILEQLMREDTAAGHPFIAALVIGKSQGNIPAPGFFQMASQLGRDIGHKTRPDMERFHASELRAALAFWSGANKT